MRRRLTHGAGLWLLLFLTWIAGRLAMAQFFGGPAAFFEWAAQATAAASAQWLVLAVAGDRRGSS